MSNYQKSSTLAFGVVKLASDSTPESEATLPITNYTLGLRLAAFSGAATSTTSGVISLTSGTLNALSALVTNGILAKTAAGTVTTRSISIGGTGLSITNADGVAGNPTITSNATNLNTVSTIVARDASGNFSAGTITAALSGNASTATKLATARTINGVAFDGTANITVADSTKLPLTGGTITGPVVTNSEVKITGSDWDDDRLVIEGNSPSIKFKQLDTTTVGNYTQIGVNIDRFFLLSDRNLDGEFDSPYALEVNLGVTTGDALKVNGFTAWTTGNLPVQTNGTDVIVPNKLCVGDGTKSANSTVVGDLEHYLELRGTTATYPSTLGVAFHHEGISTSALVHGQLNGDTGYFNLRTDDTNLKVYFKDQEVWDSATGLRASKSEAGLLGLNGNWDACTLHGIYKVNMTTFTGSTNPPPAAYSYGILHTDVSEIGGENRIMQIYYPHNSDFDRYFYQRMRNNGVWTAWAKIWRGGTGPNSGLVSSQVSDIVPSGDGRNLVEATMATDDYFRIRAYSSAYDLGEVEIATADGGNEPIHVRQYNGMFASAARTLTLLDAYGLTKVPLGVDCTNGYGYPAPGAVGNGISGGNGDNSTSTVNNLRVSSWWGIGFSPSVSGQSVPYMEYSHWFNTRNGSAGMRGALSQNSDARLKENIAVIQDALSKVQTLRGITYDRKDGGGRLTGVIAQEVQAVLPEAVTVADDEMKTLSVTYGNMVGLLIEAIKELKAEVDTLKAKVG